jgi:TRAP-type C4-dicarboxylate transport system substrate-binding protein
MRKRALPLSMPAVAVILIVALAGGGSPSVAQQKTVEWDLSLWGGSRGYTQPVERWAKAMEEKTNGRWKIEIHYGEALSPAKQNLDGLRAGLFQAAAQCAGYHPGKRPLATVYELPFLVTQNIHVQGHVQIALNRDNDLIAEEARTRWNAVMLLPGPLPPHELISRKPIRKLEDLDGLRGRVSGGMARALRRVGLKASLVPAPELYEALDQGVVDAGAFPVSYAHYAYRLHEVAKYFIHKMPLGTFDCSYFANADAWEALPEEWKKMHWEYAEGPLLDDYAETYQKAIIRDMGRDERCGPGTSFGDAGVTCIWFPEEDVQRLVKIGGQPSYDGWVKDHGEAGRKVFDHFIQKRKEFIARFVK